MGLTSWFFPRTGLALKTLAAIAALMAATTGTTSAGFFDGNDLHKWCQTSPMVVLGYSVAIADREEAVAVTTEDGKLVFAERNICFPDGVKSGQIPDIVCQWLESHPSERQRAGYGVVHMALEAAWPCAH